MEESKMEDNQKSKSLYNVLDETQDFFRKMKMELETGYPYVTWKRNIEQRKLNEEKRRARKSVLKKVTIYAGIAAMTILPTIYALTSCFDTTKRPELSASTNPSAMVWSYPGDYQARNFRDAKPFGSLDEVVLRTQDGKVVTLRPNDEGFKEQERVYKKKIVPMYE